MARDIDSVLEINQFGFEFDIIAFRAPTDAASVDAGPTVGCPRV
jgi:hypothetical protein